MHKGITVRNNNRAQKRAMRAVMIPYLQAESDALYLKHKAEDEQRERLLMVRERFFLRAGTQWLCGTSLASQLVNQDFFMACL